MSKIIIYEDPDAAPNPVQVTLEGDTVWLTQAQMAELFGRERSVITKHVRNVFRDGELNQEAVRAFFAHTAADGKPIKPSSTIWMSLFRLAIGSNPRAVCDFGNGAHRF
jgi:hypothetical protein